MKHYFLYIKIILFGKKIEFLDKISSLLINKLVQRGNDLHVELNELMREVEVLENE